MVSFCLMILAKESHRTGPEGKGGNYTLSLRGNAKSHDQGGTLRVHNIICPRLLF